MMQFSSTAPNIVHFETWNNYKNITYANIIIFVNMKRNLREKWVYGDTRHVMLVLSAKWSRTARISSKQKASSVCALHCVAGGSLKKVFTCQLCGKVLCSKASLKRHIADKHAERQEEYRCVICERVYCSRNSLMTHIYTYHKSRPGDIDIKFF